MPQATAQTDAVSRVYAQSLLELADEAGSTETLADQLADLGQLATDSPDLANLFANPALSESQRADVIQRVFEGRVDDLLYKFLRVLNAKDRLGALTSIIDAFGKLIAERKGLLAVEATFAAPPSDAELDRVRDQVAAATGKQAQLTVKVDEAIIGGVRLRIGDQLIDGSVASRLSRLKHQLIQSGQQQARSLARAGAEG